MADLRGQRDSVTERDTSRLVTLGTGEVVLTVTETGGKAVRPSPPVTPPRPASERDDARPWQDREIARAQEWRARTPPMTYAKIGQKLKRTWQAVRLKLLAVKLAEERGGANPLGFQLERGGPTSIDNQDDALVRACRVTGGFSSFASYSQIGGEVWVLKGPWAGAGGQPRPMGWKDGRTFADRSQQDDDHIARLCAHWADQDRRIRDFQHRRQQEED